MLIESFEIIIHIAHVDAGLSEHEIGIFGVFALWITASAIDSLCGADL